ncbi:MAG: phage portal protein [Liquorilactobacillus nagelii]|uniref:phage portal protein n=1 Tax=Liquorilactobacillus nagelii TaxID=82688 RepID=UPI0039E96DAB
MINPFSKFQVRSKALPTSSYSPFFLMSDGKTLANNTIDADFALRNSDIFAVVLRLSSDIAKAKLNADSQQYQPVLDNPANLVNRYGFWQEILASLMLTGNAYVSIHRNGNQVPDKLEFLPLSWVQVTLADNAADIIYTINYDDGRQQATFKSADMLHFKLFMSGRLIDQYTGISPLTSLVKELNIQDYSNNLSLSSLKNAIAPSYTLTVPEGIIDTEAKENIRQQFESQNSGSNAGRAIVLDQGLQLSALQINPDIAKLLSNTTFSQTQIAKAFCVPDSYLNGQGDQQSSTDMMRSLYTNSLPVYMEPILSELNFKFNCTVSADVADVIDVDHQQLISNLVSLTNSSNPVLDATQAQAILKSKGVFDIDIQQPTVPTINKGVDTNGQ